MHRQPEIITIADAAAKMDRFRQAIRRDDRNCLDHLDDSDSDLSIDMLPRHKFTGAPSPSKESSEERCLRNALKARKSRDQNKACMEAALENLLTGFDLIQKSKKKIRQVIIEEDERNYSIGKRLQQLQASSELTDCIPPIRTGKSFASEILDTASRLRLELEKYTQLTDEILNLKRKSIPLSSPTATAEIIASVEKSAVPISLRGGRINSDKFARYKILADSLQLKLPNEIEPSLNQQDSLRSMGNPSYDSAMAKMCELFQKMGNAHVERINKSFDDGIKNLTQAFSSGQQTMCVMDSEGVAVNQMEPEDQDPFLEIDLPQSSPSGPSRTVTVHQSLGSKVTDNDQLAKNSRRNSASSSNSSSTPSSFMVPCPPEVLVLDDEGHDFIDCTLRDRIINIGRSPRANVVGSRGHDVRVPKPAFFDSAPSLRGMKRIRQRQQCYNDFEYS